MNKDSQTKRKGNLKEQDWRNLGMNLKSIRSKHHLEISHKKGKNVTLVKAQCLERS